MSSWVLLLLWPAFPPEDSSADLPTLLGAPLPQTLRSGSGPSFTLGLWGRWSVIDGMVVDGFPFDEDVTYGDLFGAGIGFRGEAGLLWRLSRDWRAGPLLSIGVDRFEGEKDTDSAGDTLEPEDLEARSLLVGFRSLFEGPTGFWADGRVLMGAVRWSDVDATFTISGVTIDGVSFFESGTRFAFELGVRGGYRTGAVGFSLGLGLNFQGGPERGADVSDIVDPSTVVGAFLELGVDVAF